MTAPSDPQPAERHHLPDDKVVRELRPVHPRVPSWLLRKLVEHFRPAPVREAAP
jgi:hypothetical protein